MSTSAHRAFHAAIVALDGFSASTQVQYVFDLAERFGPKPEHEHVYDEIVGDMQAVLSELQDERALPIVG